MFHRKQGSMVVLLNSLQHQRDHQIYYRNYRYSFRIPASIHVRIACTRQEMRHGVYTFYVLEMVILEQDRNSIFHQLVQMAFHQEWFVIQQTLDHDKRHLHPTIEKSEIRTMNVILSGRLTLPLFRSSNAVGTSEYSRGAP